ncbi:MAG: 2'-5' RNA ligase family protein [Bacillota bacterium]|nr:2'-5' RNA ligase family protein [Bacillota bacterium]
MVNNVSWKNNFYLVAIPNGDLLAEAKRIQKILADSFDIYLNEPPPLHITICAVKKLSEEELQEFAYIVNEVIAELSVFSVKAAKFDCFYNTHNCLVLKLEENSILKNLQASLQQRLAAKNFLAPSPVTDWIFHITVISELFADTPLSLEQFTKICQRISLPKSQLTGCVEAIELWRPILLKEEKVVARFPLVKKEY